VINQLTAIQNVIYRGLIIAVMVSLALAAFVWAIMIITDDDTGWQLMATLLLSALCLGTITAAETARRRNRLPVTMILSMLLTIAGTTAMITIVWFETALDAADITEVIGKYGGFLLAAGIALAHSGALSLIPARARMVLILKILVMTCAWVVVITFLGVITLDGLGVFGGGGMGGLWVIGLIMLLICGTIIGTIALPVAAISLANRVKPMPESVKSNLRLMISCPRCGNKDEFQSGQVRCRNCRALLLIDIEEPRCECGYLLYQLQGEVCPECGRAVERPAVARAPASPVTIEAPPVTVSEGTISKSE
jgi:rRNA maturation protein Nop10